MHTLVLFLACIHNHSYPTIIFLALQGMGYSLAPAYQK